MEEFDARRPSHVLKKQLEERPVSQSSTGGSPSLNSSVPIPTKQTKYQTGIGRNGPVVHKIHTNRSEKVLNEAIENIQGPVVSFGDPSLRTLCKMVIHTGRADKEISVRVVKLDTASDVNLISEKVVTELGMSMERYNGPPCSPLGGPLMHPIGEIELEWHVYKRAKTYTTRFAVLKNDHSRHFDGLFGHETIRIVGFYLTNTDVWVLQKADMMHITTGV